MTIGLVAAAALIWGPVLWFMQADSGIDQGTNGDTLSYTGGWHDDVNGNPVPDDCDAWAASTDNPLESYTDGYDLCEAWG